jgi:hypothetical protein
MMESYDPDAREVAEDQCKHRAACEDHLIPPKRRVAFLEIYILDASDFSADLFVRGVEGFIMVTRRGIIRPARSRSCMRLQERAIHPDRPMKPVPLGPVI